MESIKLFVGVLAGLLFFGSCEERFIPEVDNESQPYIVEGQIEKGRDALPPYVLLSKSTGFFGTTSVGDFIDAQIIDAEVSVTFEDATYPLTLVCSEDLPEELRVPLLINLGLDPNVFGSFCFYIDLLRQIPIKEEVPYFLNIELLDGTELSAETTIPPFVGIDSFEFTEPPGNPGADSLARLLVHVQDPPDIKNYYRYRNGLLGSPLIAGLNSVADDPLFDGQRIEFSLPLSVNSQIENDMAFEVVGLYPREDSVAIRWSTIDSANFVFWNSFEFSAANQGPFSTYTRISSNIEGGIGAWGGYNSTTYELYVPKLSQ